jgi:hypothetical protein
MRSPSEAIKAAVAQVYPHHVQHSTSFTQVHETLIQRMTLTCAKESKMIVCHASVTRRGTTVQIYDFNRQIHVA